MDKVTRRSSRRRNARGGRRRRDRPVGAARPARSRRAGQDRRGAAVHGRLRRCSARASRRAWSWSFARENWTVAGRKIEMIKEDDEMKPPVGVRKTEKLIDSDKVDILTGPVHSGILMGMRDKVHNSKTILIVSNAGRRRRSAASAARSGSSARPSRTGSPCQPMGGWVAKNVPRRSSRSRPTTRRART